MALNSLRKATSLIRADPCKSVHCPTDVTRRLYRTIAIKSDVQQQLDVCPLYSYAPANYQCFLHQMQHEIVHVFEGREGNLS